MFITSVVYVTGHEVVLGHVAFDHGHTSEVKFMKLQF